MPSANPCETASAELRRLPASQSLKSPWVDPFKADLQVFIQSFRVCCAQGRCHGKSKSIKVEAVKKTRAVRGKLTSTDAVVIYKMKLHKTSKTAAGMATKYSITPKAVRDIWTHVTWTQQTKPFWTTRINAKYDHVIAGANHDRANASHPTPRRI